MDIVITMITVDRTPKGGKNYLGSTLCNLKRGGVFKCDCKFWLVDSGCPNDNWPFSEVPDGVVFDYDCNIESRCANLNVAQALEIGIRSGKKWILFLEDDIDVISDFVESVSLWIECHSISDINIYPLGASYDQVDYAFKEGKTSIKYRAKDFYGTQAVVFRADAVGSLIKRLRDNPYEMNREGTCYDLIIGKWAVENSKFDYFITPVPSFIQHTGRSSVINPRYQTHMFNSFPGHNWSYSKIMEGVIKL